MLRGAERIWPPSAASGSVAVPNGEGVASGGATENFKKLITIKWWVLLDLNRRPIRYERTALTAELRTQVAGVRLELTTCGL